MPCAAMAMCPCYGRVFTMKKASRDGVAGSRSWRAACTISATVEVGLQASRGRLRQLGCLLPHQHVEQGGAFGVGDAVDGAGAVFHLERTEHGAGGQVEFAVLGHRVAMCRQLFLEPGDV